MQIVSPVWRAMLDPSKVFAEATASEVLFEDDDPRALLILLHIAHCRFKELPESLSFSALRQTGYGVRQI